MATHSRRIALAFLAGMAAMMLLANLAASNLAWLSLDRDEYMIVAKRHALRERRFTITESLERVVVLGDSRLNAGFVPDAFDAATGGRTTSLNLALASHDVSRSLFELEDYMASYGRPDVVLLEIRQSPGIAGEHPLGATPIELLKAYTYEPTAGRLLALAHGVFPAWYSNHQYAFGWPPLGELRHPRLVWEERQRPIQRMIAMRGVTWWGYERLALADGYVDSGDKPGVPPLDTLDPTLVPWLDRFFRFTQKNAINVLIVNTPYRAGSIAAWPSRPEYMTAALQRYPNVRQERNGWKVKFYPAHDFFNRGHLNEMGARDYSRELAREFLTVFPSRSAAR